MTLLDAQPFDAARARRRKIKIGVVIVVILALAVAAWMFRNWPEERVVTHFFAALERQDYESAYAIYFNDPARQAFVKIDSELLEKIRAGQIRL